MLANLIASHPNVCYIGETHHAFKGHRHTDSALRTAWKSVSRDLVARLRQREDVYSPRLIRPRRPMRPHGLLSLRRLLDTERCNAKRHEMYSKHKASGVLYSDEEIAAGRLLAKNVDGMVFTTDLLTQAYPNATFIGLYRDGFAVCEGHLRRNRSAVESGARYRAIVEKMEKDAEQISRYHFVRFEDLLQAPIETTRRLFATLQLDADDVEQIRMQRRRVMDSAGNHQLRDGGKEWSVDWMGWDDLAGHCQPNVNRNQISRLSDVDRKAFLSEADDAMKRLGYLSDNAASHAA